jgi:hypothetical protein
MHAAHQAQSVPPEVEAAWLHHRFSQIHPFSDGNGRVARAIASLVLIKSGWFPLIVKREDKPRYIEALETADKGDLKPLVALFVEGQRSALLEATEIAYDVRPITSQHEAVIAARDRLMERGGLPLKEWFAASATAHQLLAFAVGQLRNTANDLGAEIGILGTNFSFAGGGGKSDTGPQMAAVRKAGYVADFASFSASATLYLNAGRAVELVFSFHGIGPRFRGLIGILAYLQTQGAEPALIEGGTFQINYEEDPEAAEFRFSAWLDRVIVAGLNAWRLTL